MFRANLQRTGVYDTHGPTDLPRVKWRFCTGRPHVTPPVLAGDILYFGSVDDSLAGQIYALDLETGEERWSATPGGTCLQVEEDRLYWASAHAVYSCEIGGGAKRRLWSEPLGLWGLPDVVDGVLHCGSLSGLYAIDPQGEPLWHFSTGGYGPTTAAHAGGLLYVGSYSGRVYAVSADSGRRRWTFRAGESVSDPPAVSEGCLYVACGRDRFYALDAAKGKPLWTLPLDPVATAPAVTRDVVCFSLWDGRFVALDRGSGNLLWTFETLGKVPSKPSIAGGMVFLGDGDFSTEGGRLYAFDLRTGHEAWRFETTHRIWADPIISDGVVYAGSADGCLYALA